MATFVLVPRSEALCVSSINSTIKQRPPTKHKPHESSSLSMNLQDGSASAKGNGMKAKTTVLGKSPISSTSSLISQVSYQYQQRVAADPAFPSKSILEIGIAASTQLIAETNRRGFHRLLPEIDFVFAATLTAIIGKYYSMWRVAPTLESQSRPTNEKEMTTQQNSSDGDDTKTFIPNNAFQSCSFPVPLKNRFYAFILPIPSLFQAGFLASLFGYGLAALLICIRTLLFPNYISQTQPVNVWNASLFTGVFVALVSNLRYQVLQGIIEPRFIEVFFRYDPFLKRSMVFLVRYANGLLGSMLAIMGMRSLGLFKFVK